MNPHPIAALERELLAEFARDARAPRAARLLAAYASEHGDWRRYALFDAEVYTRNLVARHADFEMLVLCWSAGQASPIHNHAGQHCWMAVLDGEIEEVLYPVPGTPRPGPLEPLRSRRYRPGEVAYIDDEIALHRVRPAQGFDGVSLHLYSKPIDTCRIYDESTGRVEERALAYHSIEAGRPLRPARG